MRGSIHWMQDTGPYGNSCLIMIHGKLVSVGKAAHLVQNIVVPILMSTLKVLSIHKTILMLLLVLRGTLNYYNLWFLNDTIIDFYIKYLKNKIPPEDGHREAFQRVRKWTRKVNLFEKDYIFIPINFHHHWSLIIICHPGEVAKAKGEDVENPVKVPCILHMNSIEGSHRGIMKVIQSYLWEEWNERTAGASKDYSSKSITCDLLI
ncbi:hypothetical protein MKX01_024755 [Papaver californicum]|nr:hypothetical protein MKX01_024755 [Papaver californicum]